MALRYYTTSYGSPGDVENNRITSPATISAWQTRVKEARESLGGFIECTARGLNSDGTESTSQKIAVNVEQVELVVEVA